MRDFGRVAAALLAIVLGGACEDAGTDGRDGELSGAGALEVDVAENMDRFVFDDTPVFEDGMPAYGNDFITQGYLYPYGFLDGREGVTEEGEPAFPEDVIGEWTCRGVFVGEGVRTTQGPMVITTQTFEFYDTPGYSPDKSGGRNIVVTEGLEVLASEPTIRAVTGGTGAYRGARGEAAQTFLGFNVTEGVNLRIELDVD